MYLKNKINLLPGLLIVTFIIVTFLMFLFGVVSWNTPNKTLTIIFICAICLSFFGGYYAVLRKAKPPIEEYKKIDYFKIARWVFIVGTVLSIVYYLCYIYVFLGENTFKLIRYPGASYDYHRYIGSAAKIGEALVYPGWFRNLQRVYALLSGVVLISILLGGFFFKRITIIEKILLFLNVLIYLLYGWLIGIQMIFFIRITTPSQETI